MDLPYRIYVKDLLAINEKPKGFYNVSDSNYGEDILTSKNSSFTLFEDVPQKVINIGDILCLYRPNGKPVYTGVISAFDEFSISTESIWSIFKGTWFSYYKKEDYLEHEVADILENFMQGKIGDIVDTLPEANEDNYKLNKLYLKLNETIYEQFIINKYENDGTITYQCDKVGELTAEELNSLTDPLIQKKFEHFHVTHVDSQQVHLTSDFFESSTFDMEEFIFKLFSDYGITVRILVPYEGDVTVEISTNKLIGTKISTNANSIISISPKNEVDEINKLIVMGQNGNYRKTYYVTPFGITEDASDPNRSPYIKDSIIYSDDDLNDIKAQNLKDETYNHEIIFELILDNYLYDFYGWQLGQPLDVYYKGEHYSSIFTGYEISFSNGQDPLTVEVTCGKVRSKLTDLINMSK